MSKYLKSTTHGVEYLLFRPRPPDKLISRIIDYLGEDVGRSLAVDVGCGSGQSSAQLANHFDQVVAVDPEDAQIENAKEALKDYKNIRFIVGSADRLPCKDGSASLISAVQSAHWFDAPKFFREADRVLMPKGVLAISGYRLPRVKTQDGTRDLSAAVLELFEGKFGSYIPEGSKMVYLDNYRSDPFRTIPFSSEPILREDFETEPKEAKLDDLLGYMRTWSTYQNYLERNGKDEAEAALRDFSSGVQPVENISIVFSYFLLLSRKN